MKLYFILAGVAAACSTTATAAALPSEKTKGTLDLKSIVASVDGEYLSYSGTHGNRITVDARTHVNMDSTKVDFAIGEGFRKTAAGKLHATRVQATVAHDWNSLISTRTSASLATSGEIFVKRELIQDFNFKLGGGTLLTAGGRYARYQDNIDAWSWSLGAAQYFRGGYVSYRFNSFQFDQLGHAVGHLLSARINDPLGGNQLWVGHGTALHDADWQGPPEKGNYTQVEYRRLQPIGGGVSLSFGVKRNWYDTPSTKFHGTGFRVGFVFENNLAVSQQQLPGEQEGVTDQESTGRKIASKS
jgi:YaiO family outer membrane protein